MLLSSLEINSHSPQILKTPGAIIPLHLTIFVFEKVEFFFSHIINEFVSICLRKDVLHEHEILGELHRRLIDHQHVKTLSTAAKSTWDFLGKIKW